MQKGLRLTISNAKKCSGKPFHNIPKDDGNIGKKYFYKKKNKNCMRVLYCKEPDSCKPVIASFIMMVISLLPKDKVMEKMTTLQRKECVMDYIMKEFLEMYDDKIEYATPLVSSGLIDSFSMMSMLAYIQNTFEVKIPPGKATPEAFDSIDSIVALVEKYLPEKVGAEQKVMA